MKKRWFWFNAVITCVLFAAAILFYAALSGSPPATAQSGTTDEGATQPASGPDAQDEVQPIPLDSNLLASGVLPTDVPGNSTVYFVPTDNDATATDIYLYNTNDTDQIVFLRGFSYNGVLVYSLNINVGATSFLRLASDSIVSAPPPSWATPAPVITNFTDFTYFASLSLPPGVSAEGAILFNPGTGVVNPRADQGELPLTFQTDATPTPQPKSSPTPPIINLPQVMKKP